MPQLNVLRELQDEMANCDRCRLSWDEDSENKDPHVLPGGNINADLFFIMEAPGPQEIIFKQPLAPKGVPGKVYANLLKTIGVAREDVWASNVVACRPPKDRSPELFEIQSCNNYLARQIEMVRPKLIITFGRVAIQSFLNDFKITRDHGKLIYLEDRKIKIFPMYHPAYYKAYSSIKRRKEFKSDIYTLKRIVRDL